MLTTSQGTIGIRQTLCSVSLAVVPETTTTCTAKRNLSNNQLHAFLKARADGTDVIVLESKAACPRDTAIASNKARSVTGTSYLTYFAYVSNYDCLLASNAESIN